MSRVFIGIGSNEGDRLNAISDAIRAIGALRGTRVAQMAMIAETEAVGGPPQGPYLNTVVEVETTLPPLGLLRALNEIERQLGRAPAAQRWAPRVIDLDILLYDDRIIPPLPARPNGPIRRSAADTEPRVRAAGGGIIQEPDLRVPHPRMHERRFVLEPLAELAPDVIHPVFRRSIASLLSQLPVGLPQVG